MKKYLFVVTLISGMTFTQAGEGYNVDEALMDACWHLADSNKCVASNVEGCEASKKRVGFKSNHLTK